jgi:small-conductance mechanosensitive channel
MLTSFSHISLIEIIIATFTSVLVFICLKILKRLLIKNFTKLTQTEKENEKIKWYHLLILALNKTKSFFIIIISLYCGTYLLDFPPKLDLLLNKILILSIVIQSGIWGSQIINEYFNKFYNFKNSSSITTGILKIISKLILFTALVLTALDLFGVNITHLVAGLGIGGVAIALAVQNILSDILASLSIVLDRPFEIGDSIEVNGVIGKIEKIGLKTTRLRSVNGEQVIYSNTDLLKSIIKNYKRMQERRVVFRIGVIYQTTPEQLKLIPKLIQEIITQTPKTRFDRCHFIQYADSALEFETVYWVLSPEYIDYMNAHETILLKIFEKFLENKIDFAYPTRTIFYQNAKN